MPREAFPGGCPRVIGKVVNVGMHTEDDTEMRGQRRVDDLIETLRLARSPDPGSVHQEANMTESETMHRINVV